MAGDWRFTCAGRTAHLKENHCTKPQVFTKAWSAALLNALGDVLAQKIVDKNDTLNYKRLGIFTLLVRLYPLCGNMRLCRVTLGNTGCLWDHM